MLGRVGELSKVTGLKGWELLRLGATGVIAAKVRVRTLSETVENCGNGHQGTSMALEGCNSGGSTPGSDLRWEKWAPVVVVLLTFFPFMATPFVALLALDPSLSSDGLGVLMWSLGSVVFYGFVGGLARMVQPVGPKPPVLLGMVLGFMSSVFSYSIAWGQAVL